VNPVGKRRRQVWVVLSAIPLAILVIGLLALYPIQRGRLDRADDRFRQMSIGVTRDHTRFLPAGAETVNRSVVAASCARAFSSVKAQELLTCPNLTDLDLAGCDPIDLDALGRLSALPRLRALSLADTAVNDAVLPRLAEWPALDVLNLDRTEVTAAGLSEFLRRRPIESVSVNDGKLTPAEVAGLREAFPEVEIQGGPGEPVSH
jgi:hypothetical protein